MIRILPKMIIVAILSIIGIIIHPCTSTTVSDLEYSTVTTPIEEKYLDHKTESSHDKKSIETILNDLDLLQNDNNDAIAKKCSEPNYYNYNNFFFNNNINSTTTNISNNNKYHSLICWLYHLQLNIPDEHFQSGIFSVSIKNMVCSKFELESLFTSYIPSTTTKTTRTTTTNSDNKGESTSSPSSSLSSKEPLLSIKVNGISATCTGQYHSGITGGTVTVTVSTIENKSSIETTTSFIPYQIHTSTTTTKTSTSDNNNNNNNNDKIIIAPQKANITNCQTNIQVPKQNGVQFTGSFSAKFIGLFSSSIANHVTAALEAELCPSIIQTYGTNEWNHVLKLLDDQLEHLIHDDDDNDGGSGGGDVSSSTNDHDDHVDNHYKSVVVIDKEEEEKEGVNKNDVVVTITNNIQKNETDLISWDTDLYQWKKILISINSFISTHLNQGLILSFLDSSMGWSSSSSSSSTTNNHNEKDCIDCGFFFRGINGLIRSWTIENSGVLNITDISRTFEFQVDKLGDISLTLSNVQIGGLDTFTKLELLHPTVIEQEGNGDDDHDNNKNLGVGMDIQSTKGFDIISRMEIKVDPIENGIIQDGSLHEIFDLTLNVSSVKIQAEMDVGVSRETLKSFSIGEMMNSIDPFLSSMVYANVTRFRPYIHFDLFAFQPLFANGGDGEDITLETSLDAMMNTIIHLFLNEYDLLWSESVVAYGNGPLRRNINQMLKNFLSTYSQRKKDEKRIQLNSNNNNKQSASDDQHYFHFDKNAIVQKFHDHFASKSWISKWNSFLSCAAKYIKDHIAASNKTNSSSLRFDIQDWSIENINKIQGLDLLYAVDQYHILSKVTSNWNDEQTHHYVHNDHSNTTELSIGLFVSMIWPSLNLNATFSTFASMGGLLSQIGTKFVYDLDLLDEINFYDSLVNPIVLANPIKRELTGIFGTKSSVDTLDLSFNITADMFNESRSFMYESPDETAFGASVTAILSTTTTVLQNLFNAGVQLAFNLRDDSSKSLQSSRNGDTDGDPLLWFGLLATLFALSNVVYFYFGSQVNVMKADKSFMKHQTKSIPISLAHHPKITFFLRTMVPLIIFATIIVFVISNLSTGASVDIELSGDNAFVNGTVSIPSVFTFSLGKTVSEMYQAKVYTLMALVLIFSGIWPYVKLLLMLFAWVTNERWLSLERRERLLIWLDAFGKYSLVDSFVLVLMLVSFKFHFYLPEIGMIDSFVIPKDGFYTFLLATVLSLVIGHTVTFLHRYSMMPKISSNHEGRKESLLSHCFELRHPHQQILQVSHSGRWVWLVFNLIAILLLIVGSLQKCFIFEFKGLAGVVLEDEREAHYSLLSLGTSLPFSVKDPTDIGIICIEWTYFFFALVMPFASIIVVNVLFYVPMSLKTQNRVFVFAEICNAWSAIEVFLLSVFASMLELSQFAAFMVGDHCDFLKGHFMEDLFHEDDTCFSVQSKLGFGAVYLCLGVIMQCIIMHISLRLSHQAIDERMDDEGLQVCERNKKETDSAIFKIVSLVLFRSRLSD